MSDNIFHAHLDVCAQCRNNPFGLCEAGELALRAAVHGAEAVFSQDPPPRPPSPLEVVARAEGYSDDEIKNMKAAAKDVFGPFAQFL